MVNEVFGVSFLNEKKTKFNINEGVRKKTTLMTISFETMAVIKKSPSQSKLLAGIQLVYSRLMQSSWWILTSMNYIMLRLISIIVSHSWVVLHFSNAPSVSVYYQTAYYILGRCNTGRWKSECLNINWMEANYTNCQLVLHMSNVWQDSSKLSLYKFCWRVNMYMYDVYNS